MVNSITFPYSTPPSTPLRLSLAPMEGVTDWIMRDILTQIGGIDFCVTEFLRVTKTLHPNKIFYRHCPELLSGSKTPAGVPVIFQLLGGEPNPVAENAQRVAELGAAGVDLNFGCPAKTVNRHDGGAVLLKCPERLYNITKTVRQNVPSSIPVSGKIRLGFEDTSLFIENALALQEAGAQWITVHCRTKAQGYRPPAHWNFIPQLKKIIAIPIIANGDIDSVANFKSCYDITGETSFMIGRASLSDPFLYNKIKKFHATITQTAPTVAAYKNKIYVPAEEEEWNEIERLLVNFYLRCKLQINGHFAASRTKQWLKYLSLKKALAVELFNKIKMYRNPEEFEQHLVKNLKNSDLTMVTQEKMSAAMVCLKQNSGETLANV